MKSCLAFVEQESHQNQGILQRGRLDVRRCADDAAASRALVAYTSEPGHTDDMHAYKSG